MHHPTAPAWSPAGVFDGSWLAALVIKDGVLPGGLTDAQRLAALALVWAGLPAAGALSEGEINAALKSQLAGAARCLDTDHVELRRWLVDTGFVQRDGYGRRYDTSALHALPEAARQAAFDVLSALADQPAAVWVEGLRQARAGERAARRAQWLGQRQGDLPGGEGGARRAAERREKAV